MRHQLNRFAADQLRLAAPALIQHELAEAGIICCRGAQTVTAGEKLYYPQSPI
jgi:hypothetical protein